LLNLLNFKFNEPFLHGIDATHKRENCIFYGRCTTTTERLKVSIFKWVNKRMIAFFSIAMLASTDDKLWRQLYLEYIYILFFHVLWTILCPSCFLFLSCRLCFCPVIFVWDVFDDLWLRNIMSVYYYVIILRRWFFSLWSLYISLFFFSLFAVIYPPISVLLFFSSFIDFHQ
jgi:hypothetical protein